MKSCEKCQLRSAMIAEDFLNEIAADVREKAASEQYLQKVKILDSLAHEIDRHYEKMEKILHTEQPTKEKVLARIAQLRIKKLNVITRKQKERIDESIFHACRFYSQITNGRNAIEDLLNENN